MSNWLFSPRIDAPFFLEILNGGAITPELLWLILLARYLIAEARRRGLHGLAWFHLPPSMNLIVAIFICDAGVCLRSMTIWSWRRVFGAGDFSAVQSGLLIVGGALIVIGYLCKIRAVTEPDQGNGPWLRAATLTGAAIILLLVFR
jgi:hypothetical protein